MKPWQAPNGMPKPEWKLVLRKPLSDGTKELVLSEPTAGAIIDSQALLEPQLDAPYDANGERPPTNGSAMKSGMALLADVAGITFALAREVPFSQFKMASEYLASFNGV